MNSFKGGSSILTVLLITFLGISSIFVLFSTMLPEIFTSKFSAMRQERKLEHISFHPSVSWVKAAIEDPYSALVAVEYPGKTPIRLNRFFFLVNLPNSTDLVVSPSLILNTEDCLTADNLFIQPGAFCVFVLNLTEIFGTKNLPFNFKNSTIGVTPIILFYAPHQYIFGSGRSTENSSVALTTYRTVVYKIVPLKLKEVRCGYYHTCSFLNNGSIFCWGANYNGQLGLGYNASSPPYGAVSPQPLPSWTRYRVVRLSLGGAYTCAIDSRGKVYCWGDNTFGQLGLGDTQDRMQPTLVSALANFKVIDVATGYDHTCALTEDRDVYCWGDNKYGQLGLGDTSQRNLPAKVLSLSAFNVSKLTAGWGFTCALLENTSLYCWGKNDNGELGVGDTENRSLPTPVIALEGKNTTDIFAGADFTCALLRNRTVYCWGGNWAGQLALGDTEKRLLPTPVEKLEGLNVTEIAAGGYHACALLLNGTVYCWGGNGYGQLGLGDYYTRLWPRAIDLPGEKPAVDICTGRYHTCALLLNGSLYCWGRNQNGQLGLGNTEDIPVPAPVTYFERFYPSIKITRG